MPDKTNNTDDSCGTGEPTHDGEHPVSSKSFICLKMFSFCGPFRKVDWVRRTFLWQVNKFLGAGALSTF